MTPSRQTPEFLAYERARDAVLRMKRASAQGGAADPSAYWLEELGTIDYMVEASPLIVRKLRHHAFHITGIRPYDYRSKGDTRRAHFEARLQALRELGGDALLVPESPALGGFGYEIDGRLFNVDTLKFYEVLIGMERGGILPELRGREHPVICEVGAGWAGFAYQFKTLFPTCTYVIVDFPELFLFSATYLGALFPDARFAFPGAGESSLDQVQDADFVFVPNTLARHDVLQAPDVLVNMVSFQEMTGAQVRGYAAMAADAGCRLIYSFNRERSPYNTELLSVSDALAEQYRLTEVPVLNTDYTSAMKKLPKAGKPSERSELSYRHLVGRLDPAAARTRARAGADVSASGHHRRTNSDGPRVVLGMTLYNNAGHLPEAIESLLAQTHDDFILVLLDDASGDETQSVARAAVVRDARVKYFRHDTRKAMIATWREVVEIATAECPSAEYFAWVSDHDRWHPRWLERLLAELEADPGAVLAYPITRRIAQNGAEMDKGPRLFDTVGCVDLRARWRRMCHASVGAGDMVYGVMRVSALTRAGIFRRVLRPDRLLIAELTLLGGIRQVPEALWFRRESNGASVDRQRHSLVLAGDEPKWFHSPPWFQHSVVLWQEYARPERPPLPISRSAWVRMLLRYQLTYGWKHFRKTEASHAVGRGIDNVIWTKKITRHYWHHAVYNTLVGARAGWGRTRRLARRAVYEVLTLTHRLGLRGRGKATR
ncbi:MAG TPA: putative sugar O-methyltransferase [Vicinamibacterales bacterium]|nr:putative sugar O-methyltransferase [Vicinamibacterales bacterium]